jgi:hypothetical protein
MCDEKKIKFKCLFTKMSERSTSISIKQPLRPKTTIVEQKSSSKSNVLIIGALVFFFLILPLVIILAIVLTKKKPCSDKNLKGTCATSGYVCDNGTCMPPAKKCTASTAGTDCSSGEDCTGGICVARPGACTTAIIAACVAKNQVCQAGICIANTVCTDAQNANCALTDQLCSAGGTCIDKPCASNANCTAPNFVCLSGTCKPISPPGPLTPVIPPVTSYIIQGQSLAVGGKKLTSPNGMYTAEQLNDSRLMVTKAGGGTKYFGGVNPVLSSAYNTFLQSDGNLCLRNGTYNMVCLTLGTPFPGGKFYLIMQDSGMLAEYQGDPIIPATSAVLWSFSYN